MAGTPVQTQGNAAGTQQQAAAQPPVQEVARGRAARAWEFVSAKNWRERRKKDKEAYFGIRVDPKSTVGEPLTAFENDLIKVLRVGQSVGETSTTDAAMREMLCSERFIGAIRHVALKTPLEGMDTKYAKQMLGQRDELAKELAHARDNPEYLMPVPNAHQLDVIYATMLGVTQMWDRERMGTGDLLFTEKKPIGDLKTGDTISGVINGRNVSIVVKTKEGRRIVGEDGGTYVLHENEEGHRRVHRWDDRSAWPNDKPTPPEAFCKFLEGVAMKRRPGNEGEFIGNVWKALCSPNTNTRTKEKVPMGSTLVDSSFANQHLYRRSVEPIEQAVERFGSLVYDALMVPTVSMHPVLKMPGMGYNEIYPKALQAKINKITPVEAEHLNAQRILVQAKAQYDEVMKKKKEVEKKREKIPPHDWARLESAEIFTRNAYEAAAKKAEACEKQYARVLEDKQTFEREGTVEGIKRIWMEAFRGHLLEGRDANADLNGIAGKLGPRMPNRTVTDVLDKVQTFITDREKFRLYLEGGKDRQPDAEKVATELIPAMAELYSKYATDDKEKRQQTQKAAAELVVEKKKEFEQGVADLQKKLGLQQNEPGYVPLPKETKDLILEILKGLSLEQLGVTGEMLQSRFNEIKETQSEPLRKAAELAVNELKEKRYDNLAGITEDQWIVARMTFMSVTTDLDHGPPVQREKWSKKVENWIKGQLFTSESWKKKGRWLAERAIVDDANGLRPKNFMQRDPVIMDGRSHKQLIPRGVASMTKIALKVFLATSLYVGWTQSPSLMTHYMWDGQAKTEDHWYPSMFDERFRMIRFWTWVTPVHRVKVVTLKVHDSYDIPWELPKAGEAFYREKFGVGRKLEGEANEEGAKARLKWLQSHQDTLQYFRERQSGYVLADTPEYLKEGPGTCTNRDAAIPKSCNAPGVNNGLNIKTKEDAAKYEPVDPAERKAWNKDWPVCCLVKLTLTDVGDELRLNPLAADKFVATLMSLEANHVKITHEYLADPDNRARWVDGWFLISATENGIIKDYNLLTKDNISFIKAQGTSRKASVAFYSLCHRAEAKLFILDDKRDEFVKLWIGAIRAQNQKLDPTIDTVPDDVFSKAYDTALAQAIEKKMVLDVSGEFKRKGIANEVAGLHLKTTTAMDTLVAQDDITALVREFMMDSAKYHIGTMFSDDFIKLLAQHKGSGHDINDFNPFMKTGPGSKVNWAETSGYIYLDPKFKAVQNSKQADNEIPELNEVSRAFWDNSANGYTPTVDAVIDEYRESKNQDGKLFASVLSSRFSSDDTKMRESIKAEIYRLFTSTNAGDASERSEQNFGIKVSDPSQPLDVKIVNNKKNREALRKHIKMFVMALNSPPAPAGSAAPTASVAPAASAAK